MLLKPYNREQIKHIQQIYYFPAKHKYEGYSVEFERNLKKTWGKEIRAIFVARYLCKKCNTRYTNKASRDNCATCKVNKK